MDQEALVSKFEGARTTVDALRRDADIRVEAAFWWLDQHDRWRLVLATPLVHELGPLATYRKLRELLKQIDRATLFDEIEVSSPSEGLVTVLDVGSLGRIPLNRLVLDESVRGIFVHGAYFYYFAPKTFAAAS